MSDYQLRSVDADGVPHGPWFDMEGRDQFYTGGGSVMVRKTPEPRGEGWYQRTDEYSTRAVRYYDSDPGVAYRRMCVEVEEDDGS